MLFIKPMLLHKEEQPLQSTSFINEPKWDGHRLVYSKTNGVTKLFTRHGNDVTNKYPELLDITDHEDIILDGEVIYYDPINQKDDFDILMSQRFLISNPNKIKHAAVNYPVTFIVFDILRLSEKTLYSLPLIQRKQILEESVSNSFHIQKNRFLEGNGLELFNASKSRNMEGIVQKDKNSKYCPATRSHAWKKVIAYQTTECFIFGYKVDQFGWLVGQKDANGINPLGVVEFGPSQDERKAFYQVSKSLITKKTKDIIYLDPVIKCKIKFREYTKKNKLRIPVFEEFVM